MNKKIPFVIAVIIVILIAVVAGIVVIWITSQADDSVEINFSLEKKEKAEEKTEILDETVFQAEEVITNDLPNYIEFLTSSYCPGPSDKAYKVPEGYFLHSCQYFRREGEGRYLNKIVLMNKNPWLIEENDSFTYLSDPISPGFIKDVKQTDDVYFNIFYDSSRDFFYSKYPVLNRKEEKFVFLPQEIIQNEYDYSPSYLYKYSFFDSEDSHSYGGIGLRVNNLDKKFSIVYIGFKINNPDIIKDLKIEVVFSSFDYYGDYGCAPSSDARVFSWLDLLGIEEAYACGPGNIVKVIGNSSLVPEKEENGIYWYKLENPIRLYDFPIGICYEKNGQIKEEEWGCTYCEDCESDCNSYSIHDQEHYECQYYCDYYCFKWEEGLVSSSLRMNVFYKPNNKSGFLRVQTANIVLKDNNSGDYYSPALENFYLENRSNSYNVYFGRNYCFTSDFLPLDCP